MKENVEGFTFLIRVHARAKKDAITGEVGEALKVSLTAPPVNGRRMRRVLNFRGTFEGTEDVR